MQGIRASDEHSKSRGGTFAATGALGRLPRVSSDRWFDPACPCHPPSASPARAQVRSCSGGGDELVDVAHVLRLEDKRGDGAVLDLLRREADHHADRLARPPVHRAVVGRHLPSGSGTRGEGGVAARGRRPATGAAANKTGCTA
eukprot:scaffold4490_cov130-Isochrysis_galbana.AAC.3